MSKSFVNRVARQTRVSFIGIEVVAGLIVGLSLIDVLSHLGWGYRWRDVLIGVGIMMWGVLLYGVCRMVFRFVDSPDA